MREYKFRAWDRDCKCMQYEESTKRKQPLKSWEILQLYDVVMQYTGLKDKNGKDIYEDDLIIDGDNPQRIYRVMWRSTTASWGRVLQEGNGFWYDFFDGKNCPEHFEIVGNIWENKELVKP